MRFRKKTAEILYESGSASDDHVQGLTVTINASQLRFQAVYGNMGQGWPEKRKGLFKEYLKNTVNKYIERTYIER